MVRNAFVLVLLIGMCSCSSGEPADSSDAAVWPEAGESFVNSVGMELVYIPAGEFMMGSSISPSEVSSRYGGRENLYESEHPRHLVRITRPFYMSTTEVTQSQFESVMGSNPSCFADNPNYPVEQASWDQAVEFCRRLSEAEGRCYHLPTEAQWEYACRAGTETVFYFGDDDAELGQYAWYYDSVDEGHPFDVGQKLPNEWGLYDMHGNVAEWCQDRSADDYYAESPTDDPTGPSIGGHRMLRGGAWNSDSKFCRSAMRFHNAPGVQYHYFGFRVCVTPPVAK
ncbi:MAG: formylglycine-generating enzyme family protein [Sedimentisphaerales bacterium]|nr:formylglycine-generating enzyme family protein [Sedimentisphaerales bacterium]